MEGVRIKCRWKVLVNADWAKWRSNPGHVWRNDSWLVAEKSLSAGGSERYHDKEAGIGAKVPILMLGCLTRWLQIASEICLLVRRRASH